MWLAGGSLLVSVVFWEAYRPFESRIVPELHRRLLASLELNYVEAIISGNTAVKWGVVVEEKRRRMEFNLRFESHNLAKWSRKSPGYAKVLVSLKPWMKSWPNYCFDVLKIQVDCEGFVQ